MIVVRLYGQFHLSGMVCCYPAAVIPADVMDGFAEGVEGKRGECGEHCQHDTPACLRRQAIQIPLSLAISIFFLSWSFQ
mgnify:CR=1 FL=1